MLQRFRASSKRLAIFGGAALGVASMFSVALMQDTASVAATSGAIRTGTVCPGTNQLPAGDDLDSGPVDMGFEVNLGNRFSTSKSTAYIHNDGYVHLYDEVTFTSNNPLFVYDRREGVLPSFVPFSGDVDTTNPGTGTVTYGAGVLGTSKTFCVTWDGVGHFADSAATADNKKNTFQLVLIDRSVAGDPTTDGDFDFEFNYGDIQWNNDGTVINNSSDLPAALAAPDGPPAALALALTGPNKAGTGQLALVGYNIGDYNPVEFTSSGTNATLTALVSGQRNSPTQLGRYLFGSRSGGVDSIASLSGSVKTDTGTPIVNSYVSACRSTSFYQCRTAVTGADGTYTIAGLFEGRFEVSAILPPGSTLRSPGSQFVDVALGANTGPDFVFTPPKPLSGNTTITNRGVNGGVPTVYWNEALAISTDGCSPQSDTATAVADVIIGGRTVASQTLTLNPTTNKFTGSMPALYPNHGDASVIITVTGCANPTPLVDFNIYIDPAGTVFGNDGQPLAGATVTVLRESTPGGAFEVVPNSSPFLDPATPQNPQTTGADGTFQWNVAPGIYRVRAEKSGCGPALEQGPFDIGLPVLGLEFQLQCPGGAPAPVLTVPASPVLATASRALNGKGVADVSLAVTSTIGTPSCSTGTPAVSIPVPGPSAFAEGDTVVTCTVTANAKTDTKSFTVTVTLPSPKLLVGVPNSNTYGISGGSFAYTYTPPTLENGTVVCAPTSPQSIGIGSSVTFTCTGTDEFGRAIVASWTIQVIRSSPPVHTLLNVPANITETAAPGETTKVLTYTPPTSNLGASVTCTPASGSAFALGTTTVSCSAPPAGTGPVTRTFTVTVNLGLPLLTGVPSSQVDLAAQRIEAGSAVADYGLNVTAAANATVACVATQTGSASRSIPAVGTSSFVAGDTSVTCTATNAAGVVSSTFVVKVTVPPAPVFTGGPAALTNVTSAKPVTLTYTKPTATGGVGPVTVDCTPASGTIVTIPAGQDSVTVTGTCTASDALGIRATQNWKFVITRAPAHTLTGVPAPVAQTSVNPVAVTYALPVSSASTATSPVLVTCTPASGATFPIGTTAVNCTATDAYDQVATASFNVTITKPPLPTIATGVNQTVTAAAGATSASVTFPTPVGSAGTTVTCTPASGTVFALGATTVTCTAKDTYGQSAQTTFAVTVNTPVVSTVINCASKRCEVEAAGAGTANGKRFVVEADTSSNGSGRLSGGVQIEQQGVRFQSTTVATFTVDGTKATITGSGRLNGATVTYTAVTNSSPASITVTIKNAAGAVVWTGTTSQARARINTANFGRDRWRDGGRDHEGDHR